MRILSWTIHSQLKAELDHHYKTRLAVSLKERSPLATIQEITFDGVAPNLTLSEVERFINFIDKKFLRGKIGGVGIEIGAGPGVFSSLLAKKDSVTNVYAIDACESIVRKLMPGVASYILEARKDDKIIGCIGDFNHIELEDDSVDFAFDFFSLHHSNNLEKTLSEINRVLKPGGFIFCFDKARDDRLGSEDIQRLLDAEYSPEFKKKMGISLDEKLTRRMNDEKEYRLHEWRESFFQSGFSRFEHFNIARSTNRYFLVRKAKELFSFIHPRIQVWFTWFLPHPNLAVSNLSPDNRVYSTLVNHFPKEISLMIAYK